MVRSTPKGSKWHQSKGFFDETQGYGNPKESNVLPEKSWSVPFEKIEPDFNQFLFISSDYKTWAIFDKEDIMNCTNEENKLKALRSSLNPKDEADATLYKRPE